METSIIQIGNSKGIRINKKILEQYQMVDKVEMILESDRIILKPLEKPRKGWDQSFKAMADKGEDQLLIDDAFEDDDLDSWS